MAIINPALNGPFGNVTGSGVTQLSKIISLVINILLIAGVIAFFIYFILGALKWISSGHDKSKNMDAKNQVLHAALGLAVILSLYLILGLISRIFCVNLTDLAIPNPNSIGGGGGGCP